LVKQQEATMLVQVVLYKNAEDKQDAASQAAAVSECI
jgi:hypothetical protein